MKKLAQTALVGSLSCLMAPPRVSGFEYGISSSLSLQW